MDAKLISTINEITDHDFKNLELIETALTHSSTGADVNYERLEFLGDRVLGLVIAETLYKRFPNEAEGDLAKRLAALVQGEFLAEIAKEMGLGQLIHFSEAEASSGGAENDHILADVFESVIGALYLDSNFETCQKLIEKLWGGRLDVMKEPPQHPKTRLQEWAQGQSLSLPIYKIVNQSGPDHAPIFDVELKVQGYDPLIAQGRSRQIAEKQAAQDFWEKYNK
tara:strand:+ start:6806 stop:7477 length:672 start_codon:yes stop_codon:yes gene_type:complete